MACDSGRCWPVIVEGESRKEAKRDRVLGPPYVMTLPGPPALALQLMLCPAPSPSAWHWAVLPNARNHSHICPFRAPWWRKAAFGPVRAGRYVLATAADPLTDKRERNGEKEYLLSTLHSWSLLTHIAVTTASDARLSGYADFFFNSSYLMWGVSALFRCSSLQHEVNKLEEMQREKATRSQMCLRMSGCMSFPYW